MSNGDTRVDVSSEGAFHLKLAMQLAMIYHTGGMGKLAARDTLSHYLVHDNAIWFGWHESFGGVALPAPAGVDTLVPLVLGWLRESAVYGPEPDMDGSTSRGWHLLSHWSLMPDIGGRFYLTFGVRPEWMEYHK